MKNRIRIFLFLLTIGVLTSIQSQTLIPSTQTAFEKQLIFNANYIKANKIKTITFDIIDKKDLQVAEDKGLMNFYEFDQEGRLKRYYYTTISKIIQKEYHSGPVYRKKKKISNGYSYTKNEYIYDTVSTNYFYNQQGDLILKRFNDGNYYESYYYEYDAQHRIIRERRCKETNVSPNKYEFQLGVQNTISDESFAYQETGKNQYKKICKNDEGRVYKELIINTNEAGQITSSHEQYTVAWIVQQTHFSYNKKGQLAEATFKGNANGDVLISHIYEYDTLDCVYSEKQLKNDQVQFEISYVTDTTKKLNSYIIRNPAEKTIRIVKLLYAYY